MLPTIQEYIDSFRETTDYFKTLKLQTVPSKFDANEPYFIAGGFACVFKVKQDNQFWAFKCFLQEDKHRNERLKILSEFLQQRTENYFIKTHYYTDELWVCSQLAGDAEYPTLAMPWIEGLTLGEYVHKAAKERNTDALQTIYDEFLRLAHFLLTNDFAHGDLKHDNILVTQDQNLILIDYDGMYLPQLAHISSQELGGHAYQHPKRTAQDWGKHIDDFSILVILLSLRAFIVLPSLIENHHTENLLLTDKDLQNPMQSQTLQLLWQQNDEPLKHLLGMLLNSLSQNNLRVLEIFGFVERNKVENNKNYLDSFNFLSEDDISFYTNNSLDIPKKPTFNMKWWNEIDSGWQRIYEDNIWSSEGIMISPRTEGYEQYSFEILQGLKSISISREGPSTLTQISSSLFDFKNLESLFLSHAEISEIPIGITKFIKLRLLDISDNKFTEFPHYINDLQNLKNLYMSDNQLTKVPSDIGNLTKLIIFELNSNKLTELPDGIASLTNLNILSLWNNKITQLPKNIDNLTKLKKLYLTGNPVSNQEIERIKEALPNCKIIFNYNSNIENSIKNFFFDLNWWNSIDAKWKSIFREVVKGNEYDTGFFTKIANLTELDLTSEHVTELPDWIGNLTNLTKFNLTENKLTELSSSIGKLVNLKELYLDENYLTDLPNSIKKIINLQLLDLRNNLIPYHKILKIQKSFPNCKIEF